MLPRKVIAGCKGTRHDGDVNRGRSLALVAGLSGTLSLAAGLSYLSVTPTELTISALVTVGGLGFCALVAGGFWQARAKAENRRLPLIVLGLLGLGFAAGSGLGFAGAQVAREARLEPTILPSALHVAGLGTGLVLCLLVVAELVRTGSFGAFGSRHGRSNPV